MRILIRIIQIIVGLLFIVSGLVKANDPLGLSYKMQEFFELWTGGLKQGHFFLRSPLISLFEFLHNQSLLLSVVMITLEIVAGVALLLAWRRKFILWLLLLLIVFFTFLTGYAYLSGKFTNCGCFGDCLPITPLTSFLKDVALLVMIALLLIGKKYLISIFSLRAKNVLLSSSLIVSVLIQWYALNYLPIVDCLPFKKGNNISEQMKPPPGSVPDSIVIRFIYEKNGKRYEFAPENLPADYSTYKYIDRIDKLVRKGNAEPPIKGFSLTGVSGEDSTQIILQQDVAILVFALDFKDSKWIKELKSQVEFAKSSQIPLYVISPDRNEGIKAFEAQGISDVQFFNTDFTVVRTVARTTPTVLIINKGTIINKFSKHYIGNIQKSFVTNK